tara:strand:+ start:96 stop:314 length:219 start_codon:yes stop_codon:yes gene_type:complete
MKLSDGENQIKVMGAKKMLTTMRHLHDSTLDRYRKLGLNNSTIAWLLFAEGIFVVLVVKTILELIVFGSYTN